MSQNILSAFIGASIALLLSTFNNRLKEAIRLNRIRKTIMSYLNKLALPKLERYIKDSEKAILQVQKAVLTIEDKDDPYDQMPMLTSEIIKSFSQSDLRSVCYDIDVYTELIDSYYAVDFLKENLPVKIYNNYVSWINNHLEAEKIPAGNTQIAHVRTCLSIERERQDAIRKFRMNISTAKSLIINIKTAFNKMNGKSYKFVFKYLFN